MASRVVVPESTTLKISMGDWLLVKKRLNHGERQEAFARQYRARAAGGHEVDLRSVDMAKVTVYLLDWSLVGLDGKQMVIRDQPPKVVESFLNAIDPDSFTEIQDAIVAHELAMQAERDAEKNDRDGGTASPETSPSPVVVAGVSSGLPN